MISQSIFWNYNIGWARSMHDANLWIYFAIRRYCEAGRLSPYALIGDVAYPSWLWMLSPYRGHKDGLSHEEYNWNFVQNSTRMCVERAFELLQGHCRILMKWIDIQLEMVLGIVTACIILHNLYAIQNDEFLKDWICEAQNEVHNLLQDPIFKIHLANKH